MNSSEGWKFFANRFGGLVVYAVIFWAGFILDSNNAMAGGNTSEAFSTVGRSVEISQQDSPNVAGEKTDNSGLQNAGSGNAGAGTSGAGTSGVGTSGAGKSSGGWLSVIFSGGPIGIIIVLLLATLSLCSVYLVIDQILTLRRSELIPVGLGEEARALLQAGKSDEAMQLCQQKPSMLSFVLLHGIEELPFGWTSVEKSLEDALAEQSARLYRKAEYLSVIGNIAPMVGLLGTVLGMILAFQRVAESQGTASASDLAEGIYQALITTVGGLIVAIPSLGAFAIFRNRLDQLVAETAYMAQHVFSPLRKRKSSSEKRS